MTRWQRFKHELFLLRHDFADWRRSIRRRIWNKGIKLFWFRLWIRRDEFHPSLSTDAEAMMGMNPEEMAAYHDDIARRRAIAHKRDLANEAAGKK